jgi:hypothetical protein
VSIHDLEVTEVKMQNGWKPKIRNQVQLSLNDEDLAELTKLVELEKAKYPGAWNPRTWRRMSRSSVVMELVRAELARRQAGAGKSKPEGLKA